MSTRHRVAYIILKDNVVIHRCFNQTLATRDCKGWVGRFKLHSTEPPSHTGFCLNHCTVIAKSYNAKQRKIQQRVPQPTSPRLTPVPGPFCSAPSSAYTAQSFRTLPRPSIKEAPKELLTFQLVQLSQHKRNSGLDSRDDLHCHTQSTTDTLRTCCTYHVFKGVHATRGNFNCLVEFHERCLQSTSC